VTGPRAFLRELDVAPRADLAMRLTLLALLWKPVGQAWTRPSIALLAGIGLLFAAPRRSPLFWAALLALAVWRVGSAWPLGDNHSFLLCYWLLAIALATRARDADAVLAWNGRALVGLVFAFATLWKVVLSPDYLDGRFFGVTLLDDERLEAATRLAADLDESELARLRALVREHVDGVRAPGRDDPALPPRFVAVSELLTFSLVALELAVAVVFLAPARLGLARARDPVLLVFTGTVYALAPVEGFGWLLLSMGVAQSESGHSRTRRAYAAVFAIVLVATRWPWLGKLAG
jgi:hypothetical protein